MKRDLQSGGHAAWPWRGRGGGEGTYAAAVDLKNRTRATTEAKHHQRQSLAQRHTHSGRRAISTILIHALDDLLLLPLLEPEMSSLEVVPCSAAYSSMALRSALRSAELNLPLAYSRPGSFHLRGASALHWRVPDVFCRLDAGCPDDEPAPAPEPAPDDEPAPALPAPPPPAAFRFIAVLAG